MINCVPLSICVHRRKGGKLKKCSQSGVFIPPPREKDSSMLGHLTDPFLVQNYSNETTEKLKGNWETATPLTNSWVKEGNWEIQALQLGLEWNSH